MRKKRIAVLSSVAWRTPPRQYGAWETVASNVTEGLGTVMMMGMPMFGGGNMMAVMGSFVSHVIYGGLLGFLGAADEAQQCSVDGVAHEGTPILPRPTIPICMFKFLSCLSSKSLYWFRAF